MLTEVVITDLQPKTKTPPPGSSRVPPCMKPPLYYLPTAYSWRDWIRVAGLGSRAHNTDSVRHPDSDSNSFATTNIQRPCPYRLSPIVMSLVTRSGVTGDLRSLLRNCRKWRSSRHIVTSNPVGRKKPMAGRQRMSDAKRNSTLLSYTTCRWQSVICWSHIHFNLTED